MKKQGNAFKKRMMSFFAAVKSVNPKHWIVGTIAVILLILLGFSLFKRISDDTYYSVSALSNTYDNTALAEVYEAPLYSAVLEEYNASGLSDPDYAGAIDYARTNGTEVTSDDPDYGEYVSDYLTNFDENASVYLVDSDHSVSFIHAKTAGLYCLSFDFYDLENNIANTQFYLTVNGEVPFYEAMTLVLPAEWRFETMDFSLDRYGDEIQSGSEKIHTWRNAVVYDFNGLHPGYYCLYLEQGDVVSISYVNSDFLVGQFSYVAQESIMSYDDYLALHDGASIANDSVTVAARDIAYRSDPSIRLRAERDPSNIYYETRSLVLNVIYGESWDASGQSVSYSFTVSESGYYNLSFKYRQYMVQDMSVYRKIAIDGVIPYDLLYCYAFPYSNSFINRTLSDENGDPLKVYLEAGEHTITLTAVNYPYRTTIETIQYVMNRIQTIALNVKKYTSGGTDRYRDWDIETYFPTAAEEIYSLAALLRQNYEKLLTVADSDSPSEIASLKVAASRLDNIADNINELPSLMVQFSDGDSSVNELLGILMQDLMSSSLELERTVMHGDTKLDKPFASLPVRMWEGLKRLVLSFIDNPYAASSATEGELTVWVNHPRQYIEIMQAMIDANYDGPLKVTLSQMPDQNKLILANASGQAPDVVLGVDNWIPYDFAIRNAALDLRQFSGYAELVSHFSPGAMIPFAFEDGIYAIPETQNFWVTYYRKDILENIGITEIPQTWEEIIDILPILQSYGMNYYLPLSSYTGLKPFVATIPFIYQFGGTLYTEDGMETAINSEDSIEGITLMAELFTLYNVEKYVGSFFNNFRYGTMPIGVSDLSTFLLLSTSAVELNGLWDIDLHPGVYDEESGDIVRYSACGAQASMIMSQTDYPDEAWDFLSWWMSTDVQSDFAFLLQSTYGDAYMWNTANLDAFETLSIPEKYKEVILEQWDYAIEASRIPGSYMVEREISNAWTSIVYDNTNPRQALDDAVRISNREILYKMAEFGYVEDGVIIKSYRVPTIDNIDDWLTETGGGD